MSIKTVDPQELMQWLREGSACLVDVREPAEHRATRIEKSRLMPLGGVDAARLPASGKVVVHCLKGGRGQKACEKLLQQNPGLEIYNLAGGIQAWEAAGLPVTRGRALLPLDQQVQLTIGLLLMVSALLALWVHPAWAWFCLAIGAGLALAGLTGFCAMAHVMARMPWNQKG